MVAILVFFEQIVRNIKFRLIGLFFKLYLTLHGCKVGSKIKCMGFPKFRSIPLKNITIGNNVTFGRNVVLEISESGKLLIGNNVLLADNILLSTISEIRIGDWSAIAENASIRGSFHEMKQNQPYRLQGNISEPIIIEEDTGIGAGCVVLMGTKITKGCFIGSNSVVTKSNQLEPNGIYGGIPLKLLKFRN